MTQFAEEYIEHGDKVEEVEDYTDPDRCPAHHVLDLLILEPVCLEHDNVRDDNESTLVQLFEEVIPLIIVWFRPAYPNKVQHTDLHENHRLEVFHIVKEDD